MAEISIAAAQTISRRGDIRANLETHGRFIDAAAGRGVRLIIFPELSLTGYEPDLAGALAFSPRDSRLDTLRSLAATHGMIVVAGAPVRLESGLHIACFVLFPDGSEALHTKSHLAAGEEGFFSACVSDLLFEAGEESVILAICAELGHPLHAARVAVSGATVHLASVLNTPKGYEIDAAVLLGFARDHSMLVMMANHGGDSGGYRTAGKSSAWSGRDGLLASLPGPGEGMMIASGTAGSWKATVVGMG
jgi:predicted amidohydrolase